MSTTVPPPNGRRPVTRRGASTITDRVIRHRHRPPSPTDDEQLRADSDRTSAESLTLSDADRTSSDSDRTSAHSDQWAADRAQAAGDRDLASGVNSRALSREIRQRTARRRPPEPADDTSAVQARMTVQKAPR